LLIYFSFTRLQENKAAIKAMPVSRVGDFGLAPEISGRFTRRPCTRNRCAALPSG